MGEQPIFTTKAHVFQIDPNTKKKWLPASSQAISVSYYYDSTRDTYRIISVEGSKAVINSTISPQMTFTKTSVKFGQWSDPQANTVYGLGFASEADLTKFVEKFKEIKELTRQETSNKLSSTSPMQSNGDNSEDNRLVENMINVNMNSQIASPKPGQVISISNALESASPEKRISSTSTSAVVDQLKYENDRLKLALAQSSANAKKWEVELQTLKNNNVRLTTALQESTANVEEWKRQLAIYKEESARMKKKVLDTEKGSNEAELTELKEMMIGLERNNKLKEEEMVTLRNNLEGYRSLESHYQQLTEQIKSLEHEKESLINQTASLKEERDGLQTSYAHEKQKIKAVHEQLSSKLNDLQSLSDKLTELLHQH